MITLTPFQRTCVYELQLFSMRNFNFISQLHSNNDKFYYYCHHRSRIICKCWNRIYFYYSKYNQCGNCTRSIAEEMHTFNAVIERHHHAHISNAKHMMLTPRFTHIIEINYATACIRVWVWEFWNGIFVHCVPHF